MARRPCPHGSARRAAHLTLALAVLGSAIAGSATAGTRWVATSGFDSGACGASTAAACRTITQAIANATAGDTVVVGPGTYGDVNFNGTLDAGEENAAIGDPTIDIDKTLRVVSRDGAAATVILSPKVDFAVRLGEPGTVFGGKGRGFTIIATTFDGDELTAGIFIADEGCVVEGNVVSGGGRQDPVEGRGRITDCIYVDVDAATVRFNRLRGCVQYGLWSGSGVVAGNVFEANGLGMRANGFPPGPLKIEKNVFLGNEIEGLSLLSGGVTTLVQKNAFLGNVGPGVRVFSASGLTLRNNTIIGNGGASNCGLSTEVTDTATVATRNYWGTAAGPGADPADAVCDTMLPSTVAPALPAEVKVIAPALR